MPTFNHTHPYEPFLFTDATKLIVGTLPPPRFTTGDLKEDDVNFCYGSRNGLLWPILDQLFKLDLVYENSRQAVLQRKTFLQNRKIGICDIVASAKRDKLDASDLGMKEVVLRDLLSYLAAYPQVETLLFTGGNSKNGPEYFFRRLLKRYGITLSVRSDKPPREHSFVLPTRLTRMSGGEKIRIEPPACAIPGPDSSAARVKRTIRTVSLIAPSGAANRAIGSLSSYKAMKKANPEITTLDFRVQQYSKYF